MYQIRNIPDTQYTSSFFCVKISFIHKTCLGLFLLVWLFGVFLCVLVLFGWFLSMGYK